MTPDVSIVIVNWNTKALLLQCLDSIKQSTRNLSLQIIVVDNASSDGSSEAVTAQFPGVTLVCSSQNLGFAKANNKGLHLATGRYVALINSDVIVLEDCLQTLIRWMDCHADIGLVGPEVLNGDRTLQHSGKRDPNLWRLFSEALFLDKIPFLWQAFPGSDMKAKELANNCCVEVLSGCFWMARKEALIKVGGLDERFFMYCEDNDWCRRFRLAGWIVFYYKEARAVHFGGASSANAPERFFIELKRAQLQYLEKYYGNRGRIIGRAIVFLHSFLRVVLWSLIDRVEPNEHPRAGYIRAKNLACLSWLRRETTR